MSNPVETTETTDAAPQAGPESAPQQPVGDLDAAPADAAALAEAEAPAEVPAPAEAAASAATVAFAATSSSPPSEQGAGPSTGSERVSAPVATAAEAQEPTITEDGSDTTLESSGEPNEGGAAGAEAEPSDLPISEAESVAAASATPRPELEPLIAAMHASASIPGMVIGWNKGGYHVVINGVPAFCPKSQMELGNPRRANAYLDKTFPFRVTEIRDNGRRVVVSRKAILAEERTTALERLRQAKNHDQALTGTVSSITEFGAFVDIEGIEGLVHLSQLSRKRVDRAQEVVQLGQEVQVKVLKIEKGGERISLSMRALEPDPWDSLQERFSAGDRFAGKVVRRAEFGLFVEIEEGVEGLVHESALALGGKLDDSNLAEGSTVEGWVKDVDARRRRLSLSLREIATANPWPSVGERYPEGTPVNGTVEQIAKFGIFIELEPGLTGLLPLSSLSLPIGVRAERQFRPGQEVQVVIDSIDAKRRRISLAPVGSQLEGTRADLKEFKRQQKDTSGGLNAMRSAFEKLNINADA